MSIELKAQVEEILSQARGSQLPDIVQAGHPQLRRKAAPWRGQLPLATLSQLIELMRTVMHKAPGVGLAAPQLGIDLQLAVAEDNPAGSQADGRLERMHLPFFAMLNPRYAPIPGYEGQRVSAYEGCLSFRGYSAVMDRYRGVRLEYLDSEGVRHQRDLTGWPARIAQHETDHLHGVLYIDLADSRSLVSETARYPVGH